jgi:hypothetical protein
MSVHIEPELLMTRPALALFLSRWLGVPVTVTCPGPAHVLVAAQGCTDRDALAAAHREALDRIPMWVYLEVVGRE